MQAGIVVGDRYRLDSRLGAGGMGEVWRARHVGLGTDVAVKLMSEELLATPGGEARFLREARAVARLESKHIVHVFDCGVSLEGPYLAMELLHGEDLAARLAREGPLPPAEVVEAVRAIASGLEVAHAGGIVHRDLKPANLFLHRSADGETLKILDFGIARQLGSTTGGSTGGSTLGTPEYMSPEQVWGEDVCVETDTWALAVIAYEMLSGANPFADPVLARVYDRVVKATVPSVRASRPDLPEGIDAFFARALAREPAGRFRSARELDLALLAALGEPGAAPDRLIDSRRGDTGSGENGAPAGTGKSGRARVGLGIAGLGAALLAGALLAISRPPGPPAVKSAREGPHADVALTPSTTGPAPSAEEWAGPSASTGAASAARSPRATPKGTGPPRALPRTPGVHPRWGVPVR